MNAFIMSRRIVFVWAAVGLAITALLAFGADVDVASLMALAD